MKTDNGLGETPAEVKRLHVWAINPGFGRKTHPKGTKEKQERISNSLLFIELLQTFVPFG
jgi:hypothetical protein